MKLTAMWISISAANFMIDRPGHVLPDVPPAHPPALLVPRPCSAIMELRPRKDRQSGHLSGRKCKIGE
ncbi:hypothetical protein GA0070615_2206 [Micromonospora aurantiaca]|nr:hypothetical protein GA0070615_2206 [Micromonospora aurantiaca]